MSVQRFAINIGAAQKDGLPKMVIEVPDEKMPLSIQDLKDMIMAHPDRPKTYTSKGNVFLRTEKKKDCPDLPSDHLFRKGATLYARGGAPRVPVSSGEDRAIELHHTDRTRRSSCTVMRHQPPPA